MHIKQEPGTVTGDMTERKPNIDNIYSDKEIKTEKEESSPLEVKTECCLQEKDSALPGLSASQAQLCESTNEDIKDQESRPENASRSHESCFDNIDLQQAKETSSNPMQSTNSNLTNNLLLHQEELDELSTQLVLKLKSELNSTNINVDVDKCCTSKNVKDVHKNLPSTSDDVHPNQKDQVIISFDGNKYVYSCGRCDYTCAKSNQLRQHKKTHTSDKTCCKLCNNTCAQSKRRRKPASEKRYCCDLCSYTGARLAHLKQHKIKHTKENLSCDLCDYTCSQPCHLKMHKRKHTGEKPYSCDICDYTCRQKIQLQQHKRKHTGEKPYSCDICCYATANASSFIMHKRIHTGEKLQVYCCDRCGYTCTYLPSFKLHQRTHTGEKPFRCDLCGYKCTQMSTLKIHLRIHTGEKPYSCDFCDYSCSVISNLKQHIKRRHKAFKSFSCDLCNYTCAQAAKIKQHLETHVAPRVIIESDVKQPGV